MIHNLTKYLYTKLYNSCKFLNINLKLMKHQFSASKPKGGVKVWIQMFPYDYISFKTRLMVSVVSPGLLWFLYKLIQGNDEFMFSDNNTRAKSYSYTIQNMILLILIIIFIRLPVKICLLFRMAARPCCFWTFISLGRLFRILILKFKFSFNVINSLYYQKFSIDFMCILSRFYNLW